MSNVSAILANIDSLIASLTVLFPGILAYFVYVGLRSTGFQRLARVDLVIILLFTLLFEVAQSGLIDPGRSLLHQAVYFIIAPVLLGVVADLGQRFFVTSVANRYQRRVIDGTESFELIDVGNVSRWQKTVKSFVRDGIGDVTKEYYVEVDLEGAGAGEETRRGFLNGYSDDDIELLRYDDLSEKSFEGVGTPDIDTTQLTQTIELIPRGKIIALRLYRVKMEDFELE